MPFAFATAGKILFGAGALAQVAPHAAQMGRRALVVTGSNPHRSVPLTRQLEKAGLTWLSFCIAGEPHLEHIVDGAALSRQEQIDLVIGLGGGAALDSAKAIAALTTTTRPIEAYVEVIGQGKALEKDPLPCIAIPTTAGTGSEVTSNAVLLSPNHHVKVSLRSPKMFPDLAVVDPELTLSMPPDITAFTGCDALTQLLESFVSSKANPLTDAFGREGLPRAARALPRAVAHGGDMEVRTQMSLASLLGGLTLANAGLGAVHGIAGPLGGMIKAPHGALCAALLPHVMEVNIGALEQKALPGEPMQRFIEAARLPTNNHQAGAEAGIHWLHRLTARLQIPSLAHWGLTRQAIPEVVRKAQAASSMKGNPVRLSDTQLTAVVEKAMGPVNK